MIQPRKAILNFAQIMETKLSQHDDRPDWLDEELPFLVKRFRDEILELDNELGKARPNPNHIILECADVANMAMMIAETASKRLKAFDPRRPE